MKTVQIANRVESETQNVSFGFQVDTNDDDSYMNVTDMNEEQLSVIAVRYNIKPEFLVELDMHFTAMRDAIHSDLADIWARIGEK